VRQAAGVASDDAQCAAAIGVDHHGFGRSHGDLHLTRAQRRIDLLGVVQDVTRGVEPFVLHEALTLRHPQRQTEQRARDVGDMKHVRGAGAG
jgi:hypothetical protein